MTGIDPKALSAHYSMFRVRERVLLTGHSHQAWPDVAFEAQQRAFLDAAELVDLKWERAEAQALRVREGFARLLGDSARNIALGQNTHELVTRWLSALPLDRRRRIVTSDGEFHSLRRQLDRLTEVGLDIVKVPALPVDTLAERVARTVDDSTAAVMMSSVLFETAAIVPGLDVVASRCQTTGSELLVDAYHHLNVVPFDIQRMGLTSAFVTGGGYKYCQLGEGNCFLRLPADCRLQPVLTGWFAEFGSIEQPVDRPTGHRGTASPRVRFPPGAGAFAGSTYDPTSHYRAAAVFDFHFEQQLTPDRLRALSQHQIGLLQTKIEAIDLDPAIASIEPIDAQRRGGFLAVRTPLAQDAVKALRGDLVWADARGDVLRLGPAPYVTDDQLRLGVEHLNRRLRGLAS